MATKTSKRTGEVSTTVNVGIRIDPKIKFSLDIMGRLQKRSLTAVIEWAISNAIAQEVVDGPEGDGQPVSKVIDRVWSTDEATKFINMCFEMPSVLTYDERRIWDTVLLSPIFWKVEWGAQDRSNFDESVYRDNWEGLKEHVELMKNYPRVIKYDPFAEDLPF